MNRKKNSLDLIVKQGLLPLYYYADAEVSIGMLRALYEAGIRAVEYTNRGGAALDNFRQMLRARDASMPDMQLGIGTIKTAKDAALYIEAGADYIISPGLVPAVAEETDKAGLLWVPGCMTTTEIIEAEQLGASFVKLFPGNLLGPSFMSAIKELFPEVLFMPTGGVDLTEESIRGWFDAGVCAVGMGSKLITKAALEAKDYETVSDLTGKVLKIIGNIRNN